jgi:hypothetical protein
MTRVALLSLALLAACHSDRQGTDISDHERRWSAWDRKARQLSQRATQLEQLRQLLRWYGLTGSEPSKVEALYGGLDLLVDRERLLGLHRYENTPLPGGATRSEDESLKRRQVRYLRHHLALLHVQRRGLQLQDRYSDQLLRPITVGDSKIRVADFPSQIGSTQERAQRQQLQDHRGPVLRRLEQLQRRQYALARQESRRLGLSLFKLMEGASEQETPQLLHRATALVSETKRLFSYTWDPLVKAANKEEAGPLRFSDLHYLHTGAGQQNSLAEAQLLPSLELLLGRMNLELTAARAEGLASSCVPVGPTDVRVAYRSTQGLLAYVQLFEAAGEAVCRTKGGELPWAFRAIGPQLGAQTLKYLLGLVWLEREWWSAFNKQLAAGGRLTDDQIADLVHTRIWQALLRIRIQGVIVPAVRVVLEGGPPAAYAKVWSGESPGTPSGLFARLVQRQLGLKLRASESLAYVDELTAPNEMQGLGRPFDLRAYVLAYMALERVRKRFGERWFAHRAAGRYLIEKLCTRGSSATALDLARNLESKGGLDYKAPVRVLQEAWSTLQQ